MIVMAGDCLVDLIQSERTDTMVQFDGLRGGSTYNTAIAASRQGARVGFLTPISTDTLGQFMADEMDRSGVTLLAPRNDAPTSLAVVTLSDGQPSYQFYRQGVADRQIDLDMLQRLMPDEAEIFHVSSLGLADGQDADDLASAFVAQADRALLTIDPNIRPLLIPDRAGYLQRLWPMLAAAHVIKLSDEDLEWIFDTQDLAAGFAQLMERTNAPLVILTLGDKGARANFANHDLTIPVGQAGAFVDSVGAGDTFMGAVVSQLAQHQLTDPDRLRAADPDMIEAILNRASQAAAINCARKGCNPPWQKDMP